MYSFVARFEGHEDILFVCISCLHVLMFVQYYILHVLIVCSLRACTHMVYVLLCWFSCLVGLCYVVIVGCTCLN